MQNTFFSGILKHDLYHIGYFLTHFPLFFHYRSPSRVSSPSRTPPPPYLPQLTDAPETTPASTATPEGRSRGGDPERLRAGGRVVEEMGGRGNEGVPIQLLPHWSWYGVCHTLPRLPVLGSPPRVMHCLSSASPELPAPSFSAASIRLAAFLRSAVCLCVCVRSGLQFGDFAIGSGFDNCAIISVVRWLCDRFSNGCSACDEQKGDLECVEILERLKQSQWFI